MNSRDSKQEHDKIDVLYILGLGHSGSTLLSRILGSYDNIESIGEIHHFPLSLKKYCNCGYSINNCQYWSDIMPDYFELAESNHIEKPKNFMYNKNISRWNKLWQYVNPKLMKQHNELALKYKFLLQGVQKNRKSKVIVLNCKNALLGYILFRSTFFNVKFIHLYRSAEGNYSSYKDKARRLNKEFSMLKYIVGFIFENINNLILMSKVSKDNKATIIYEELCKDPVTSIKNIDTKFKLDIDGQIIDRLDEKNKLYFGRDISHELGGNGPVLKEIKKIKDKKKWKNILNRKEKIITFMIGKPFEFILRFRAKR